jgi:flavin-binding protein dodecin
MPNNARLKIEDHHLVHAHRTAKVIELVASSTKSFEDAVKGAVADANASTRGITGAHVENMSVRCKDGKVVEYKVNLKVAFGIERTKSP